MSPVQRLRRWVRKRTPPIEPTVARAWKLRLSFIYAIIGWQAFALAVYQFFNYNAPKNQGSIDYAKLLGVKNATVVRFSGLTKVDEYEIKLTDEDIDDYFDTYVHKIKPEKSDDKDATIEGDESKSNDSKVTKS
ncbi:hypothetical protein QAD02_004447 [Eretmocerus hayati]|uniref:Uncharacterized protein n=1 Tax=Eretmocerus hayati TaxID=131215 RepID=A0ACC2NUF0_9HYME|nr:hypothetical protein QAD02_004447 [Eretmocerus hayati]